MYKVDKRNFIIESSEKISKSIIQKCNEAYSINGKFFSKKPEKFKILICNNEDEFKKAMGRRYRPWIKGAKFRDTPLIIRSPSEVQRGYRKYGGTRTFDKLLIHEMSHVFGIENNMERGPYWLSEGVATYLAEQKPSKKPVKSDRVFLMHRRLERKMAIEMYRIQYYFTKYLVEMYGKKKLQRLIDSLTEDMTKNKFEKEFRRIYKKSSKEAIDEFIETIE